METDKTIIVAVELGTTAIRAIAIQKKIDGSTQIMNVVQEEANGCIRNGAIENLSKTSQAIARAVSRLDAALSIKTTQVYIGLSGQSLHTVQNVVERVFEEKVLIKDETIDQLKEINNGTVYPGARLLDVIPQDYRMGHRATTEPVGWRADSIQACFANVIARAELYENIEYCVQEAKLQVAEIFVSPLCLAEVMLASDEKSSGCALVDMGADTTTVICYTKGVLRQIAVLPIGGSTVTSDLACEVKDFAEAEALKKKYGVAYVAAESEKTTNRIAISHGRSIAEQTLQEVVEARYEEILANVWHRISAHSQDLLSGITFIGGAAQIPNLREAFEYLTKFDRQIRVSNTLPSHIKLQGDMQKYHLGSMQTLVALALSGNESCANEARQTGLDFGEGADTTDTAKAPVAPEIPEAPEDAKGNKSSNKKGSKPKGPGFGERFKKGLSWIKDTLTEDEE